MLCNNITRVLKGKEIMLYFALCILMWDWLYFLAGHRERARFKPVRTP